MIKYLLGKSSTNKFRWWQIEWDENTYKEDIGYELIRTYGQVHGKITTAPSIYVLHGKAKRTTKEQALLQFNSEVKKQLDKGYKEVPKHPNDYSESELQEIYGDVKVREGATVKPMLAKQEKDIKNRKIFDNKWYISRKVNGVRCLIYFDGKNIRTASRGATNYDIAIIHIIQHPILEEFFKNHPDAILDGEVFKKDWSLNKISGICRSQKTVNDGKDLQFYWYDIVDLEQSFSERWKIMQEWSKELQLSDFDPYKYFSDSDLHIQFLPQELISGFENMKKLHDEWVKEGWEGAVIRNPDSVYKPGSRGNDWIKIKVYQDAEYPIVGLSEGLRDEDMCFILETPNGQRFNCKPIGDREQKQWYRDHIDELVGKNLTIKYFEMSGVEGSEIPQQPIGICVRDYE